MIDAFRRASWLGCVALLGVGCMPVRAPIVAAAPVSSYRYPRWFVDGQQVPAATVGFAPRYESRALSESLAVVDGMARERAYRALRFRGESAFIAGAGQSLNPVGEWVRVDTLAGPAAVGMVAYADLGTLGIALVGAAATAAGPPAASPMVVMSASPPPWIDELPRTTDGVIALGIARMTFREEIGWQAAEQHGLTQLAAAIWNGVQSVQRTSAEGQETVLTSRIDVVLRDVVVLARWRDGENCFVLMRGWGGPALITR